MPQPSSRESDSPRVGRRLVLSTGAAVAALAAAGLPVSSALAATSGADPGAAADQGRPSGPRRRAASFLDATMDAYPINGATRLAQSYADQSGLFSTAFTYDHALAILAYLADG